MASAGFFVEPIHADHLEVSGARLDRIQVFLSRDLVDVSLEHFREMGDRYLPEITR